MPAARRSARGSAAGPSSALAAAQLADGASASGSSVVFVDEKRASGSRARATKQRDAGAAAVKPEPLADEPASTSGRPTRASRVKNESVVALSSDAGDSAVADAKPARRKAKQEAKVQDPAPSDVDEDVKPAVKAPRGKAKKEAEPRVFPARTQGSTHFVGAHVSMAGGIENSIEHAKAIGANAFALFVRPKMAWASKPIPQANVDEFKRRVIADGYTSKVMPHGCYLTNLGNPDEEKREKSMGAFIDDLERCALLDIGLFNFHPGSSVGDCSTEEACRTIAECINRAHKQVKNCPIILLENMAGAGNIVGGRFSELGDIIKLVKDKSKVGVCLDTCHAFAAGYDLREEEPFEAMMAEFDREIGLKYLKGLHLNDSLGTLGSHKDRHANIGLGELGLWPFWKILNDPRFADMPLCLETPGHWEREVPALYALQGRRDDPEDWVETRRLVEEVRVLRERAAKAREEEKAATKGKKGEKGKKEEKGKNGGGKGKQGKKGKGKKAESDTDSDTDSASSDSNDEYNVKTIPKRSGAAASAKKAPAKKAPAKKAPAKKAPAKPEPAAQQKRKRTDAAAAASPSSKRKKREPSSSGDE